LPRLIGTRNHGDGNRITVASDIIRKANVVLNRLENPGSIQVNRQQSSASNAEQLPEGSQQTEATTPSVPPESVGVPESSASESSAPQSQTDPDSVNVYD